MGQALASPLLSPAQSVVMLLRALASSTVAKARQQRIPHATAWVVPKTKPPASGGCGSGRCGSSRTTSRWRRPKGARSSSSCASARQIPWVILIRRRRQYLVVLQHALDGGWPEQRLANAWWNRSSCELSASFVVAALRNDHVATAVLPTTAGPAFGAPLVLFAGNRGARG